MQDTDTVIRRLALPLEVKAGGEPGTFEGYGAIFGNKDKDGDIVARGAFSQSLKATMPALLWQHDQKSPIGRFDEVREDEKGLYVKGRLALHGRGLEAYELLKMGALNGLSIGFVTKEASRDPATRTRTITEAGLMEVSLVTFPANELARVNSVKAANFENGVLSMPEKTTHTARSFERLLRENGFSRSRAKAITAKGFRVADLGAGESAEIAEMVQELKARQDVLEQKGFQAITLKLAPGKWTDWERLATIQPTAPAEFKLIVSRRNPGRIRSPFMLRVKYRSISGMKTVLWTSNANAGHRFKVPEGLQEVRIQGRQSTFLEAVKVSLSWVR